MVNTFWVIARRVIGLKPLKLSKIAFFGIKAKRHSRHACGFPRPRASASRGPVVKPGLLPRRTDHIIYTLNRVNANGRGLVPNRPMRVRERLRRLLPRTPPPVLATLRTLANSNPDRNN